MQTFAKKQNRPPWESSSHLTIQTKLAVDSPADLQEQEADRAADQVMGKTGMLIPARNLNTRENSAIGTEKAAAVAEQGLHSPGQPLHPATRGFMEERFGHDFSRVRVHSDEKASESSHSLNALAYTVGQDIVFAQGQYAPYTPSGQHLLAHELAHVTQQARGGMPAVQRKTFFGPNEKAGAPSDWADQVKTAANSTDRTKLIQTVLGSGVTIVDKTAAGAADTSPTVANLVEYSASNAQVNYDDGLNSKKSPVDSHKLKDDAGYTLNSGGKYYVILGPKSLDGGRYTYPIVILNHELDHVRQSLAGSSLKGDESELDAWTSSFIRDFHHTYRLSDIGGSTCYMENISTWIQLLDYYQRSGVSTTQQDASVKSIKDYYNATIKPHEGHKAAFNYWVYITLKNTSVTVNIADKINTALSLGISASDDVMKYRKFTCSSTIQSLTYSAPTIDKPAFPAPKPAKP